MQHKCCYNYPNGSSVSFAHGEGAFLVQEISRNIFW
jgi:hypothetical protein